MALVVECVYERSKIAATSIQPTCRNGMGCASSQAQLPHTSLNLTCWWEPLAYAIISILCRTVLCVCAGDDGCGCVQLAWCASDWVLPQP
jgi:hypothetical protein